MSDMEVWKPVPGYEGFYSVSDLGRVRSDKRTIVDKNGHGRKMPEIILTPEKKSSGHLTVCLCKNHDQTKRYVHRIVLEAFIGEAPAGMQACHWNDDTEEYANALLLGQAKYLAEELSEEKYQYGVTYTGLKHGGQHIEWVEPTKDAEFDKETLQLLIKRWKKEGQSPKIVRRRVSAPEVISE